MHGSDNFILWFQYSLGEDTTSQYLAWSRRARVVDYDQYNANISKFNTFTLGMICVTVMGSHNSGQSCFSLWRHSLVGGGQCVSSWPPARCVHVSALLRNPALHFHLYVRPVLAPTHFSLFWCFWLTTGYQIEYSCVLSLRLITHRPQTLRSSFFLLYSCWKSDRAVCGISDADPI